MTVFGRKNFYRNQVYAALIIGLVGLAAQVNCSAQLTIKSRQQFSGKIKTLSGNSLSVTTDDGDRSVVFTKSGEATVPLPKAGVNLRHQTTIKVNGNLPASELATGQWVQFRAMLSKTGKSKSEVEKFALLKSSTKVAAIEASRQPENTRDYVDCQVTARIESIRRNTINLVLSKQDFAPRGTLRIRTAEGALVSVAENTLDRCRPGDRVKQLAVIELDSGDLVAEKIEIELAERAPKKKLTKNSKPNADPFSPENYVRFSDAPARPRDLRSRYFLLHTDISDRSGRMLLDKLEYMIGLVSRYYGKLPNGVIECYVVRDLSQWKDIPLEAAGVAKIQERAGVTISRSLGNQRRSVVYSCDKHGVVQHEAVHAYCAQTFGSTGPTWYSEGMAEMGQYWKKDNLAVDISAPVINYLTKAQPKKMADIVAAGQITGDSWQAYAWRWALCHLLANNSNYSDRFKQLGLNMMSGGKATFETVYGDVAREISFEYDQFVKNFGNGYRVDLCQWDWTTKPVAISGQRRVNSKIDSSKGWQSSKLQLNKGKKYEFVCVGQWQVTADGQSLDGGGDQQGRGKLIGVVFSNYQLSQVIELGQSGEFVAEQDGHLFLRCREPFTNLADNKGTMTVHFRRAQKK